MNAIKSYRERSGMKQLEVAGRIGISVATLRRYETAAQLDYSIDIKRDGSDGICCRNAVRLLCGPDVDEKSPGE